MTAHDWAEKTPPFKFFLIFFIYFRFSSGCRGLNAGVIKLWEIIYFPGHPMFCAVYQICQEKFERKNKIYINY